MLTGKRIAWEYAPGLSPDLDLSLVELSEKDALAIERTYQFTTPADFATTRPKARGIHYIISGYPAVRNRFVSQHHYPSARSTYLTTGDILAVSTLSLSDKTDETHFALALPFQEIPRIGGGHFRVPKAAGMSGGGVWRIEIHVSRKWVTAPLLVGIGIEHHKSKGIFVATRVQHVIPLLHDLIGLVKPHQ